MSNSYERQFFIFRSMDSMTGNPSGFLKIEVNGDNAKLQLSLNNLSDRNGFEYKLYAICKGADDLQYTDICSVPVSSGRADIRINSNINQIGSHQMCLKDISIYALITRYPDNKAGQIICPLVSYTKQEQDWRSQFEKLLAKASSSNSDEIPKIAGYMGTASGKRDEFSAPSSGYRTLDKSTNETVLDRRVSVDTALNGTASDRRVSVDTALNETVSDSRTSIDTFPIGTVLSRKAQVDTDKTGSDESSDVLVNTSELNSQSGIVFMGDEETKLTGEDEVSEDADLQQPWTILDEEETDIPDVEEPDISGGEDVDNQDAMSRESVRTEVPAVNNNRTGEYKKPDENSAELANKFQGELTSVYKNIGHGFHEIFGDEAEEENETGEESEASNTVDVWQKIQNDFNDISSININKTDEEPRNGLSIPALQEELDKSFEVYNPFKNRSRNFKWWKINSPGFLNNILFRNNIKTYLLFNPKVMLAHYKYRYIILGIRGNRLSGKERLVCGVPGIYSIDDNPFGSMGSWVQMEGYRPKYGAFGYWVVMIDPRTGKLIKIK